MPHRKNRVVTRMRGAIYRRSVMGAEVVISLSQSSIKVHVAAIHEQVLLVMCAARAESRKTTIAAISSGEVILCSRGILERTDSKLLFGI